jgi:hypothetical protein
VVRAQKVKGHIRLVPHHPALALTTPWEASGLQIQVCGVEMAPTEIAARLTVGGREVVFCCEKCVRVYLEASQRRRP